MPPALWDGVLAAEAVLPASSWRLLGSRTGPQVVELLRCTAKRCPGADFEAAARDVAKLVERNLERDESDPFRRPGGTGRYRDVLEAIEVFASNTGRGAVPRGAAAIPAPDYPRIEPEPVVSEEELAAGRATLAAAIERYRTATVKATLPLTPERKAAVKAELLRRQQVLLDERAAAAEAGAA